MIKSVSIDRDVSITTNFKHSISEALVTEYLKNPKLVLQSSINNGSSVPEAGFLILPNNFYKPLKQNCNINISFDVEQRPVTFVPEHVEFNCIINKANSDTTYEKYTISMSTILAGDKSDFGSLVEHKDVLRFENLTIQYEGFLIESLNKIDTTAQFNGIVGTDRLVIEKIQ